MQIDTFLIVHQLLSSIITGLKVTLDFIGLLSLQPLNQSDDNWEHNYYHKQLEVISNDSDKKKQQHWQKVNIISCNCTSFHGTFTYQVKVKLK